MFRRLVLDHSMVYFTTVAFFVSASIFAAFLWRALRMKPKQVQNYSNLPFADENPSVRHDS